MKHLISFRHFLWTKGIDGGGKLTRNVSFISRLLFKLNLLIENNFFVRQNFHMGGVGGDQANHLTKNPKFLC